MVPFKQNKWLHAMMIAYAVFWIWAAISPTNRTQWFFENMLVVAFLLALVFTYRKYRFTNTSYACMFIFLCFHTYAAHYTYDQTPFDLWLKAAYHTRRSYFDRVVHFLFGLLWTYPIRELLLRFTTLRKFWTYVIPVAFNFAFSALFEIMEMAVAMVGGQPGQDYLGLQGDIYDTQKDMGLGLAGAMVAAAILADVIRARARQASQRK